ncbi:MAG: hypothetical protein P1U39_08575 [Legionellaceae bacterium]|nr:hypothetical protein [Legionellaceae bacterium]
MGIDNADQANLCPPEVSGILESPSYFLLDDKARALVDRCADLVDIDPEQSLQFPVDLRSAILNRRSLIQALDEGQDFLKSLNPAAFEIQANAHEPRYDAELDVIEHKLKLLSYLILMSAERAKETRNLPLLPEHRAYLERVTRMLIVLRRARRGEKSKEELTPQLDSPNTAGDQDNPMRYFGMLYIVPAIERAVTDMTLNLNQVEKTHDIIASFNDLRLYLVWANALSQSICNVIVRSVQQTLTVTQAVLNDLALATGSLGFILYFTTFGIASSIVLQNTLECGLTPNVRALELGWYERFKTQWDERKFLLLNNAVWGLVNFVCFFWLVGQNVLGFWGNVLTGVLFIADMFLVWWQLEEAQTKHQARLGFYDKGIKDLSVKITDLSKEDPNNPYIARLKLEQVKMQDTQKRLEQAWCYQKKQYELDLMYGASIILGFTVLCGFFFPPALIVPCAAMILALTGAAMCFAFGVAHKAFSGQLVLQKEVESRSLTRGDFHDDWDLFQEIASELKKSPEDTKLQTESKLLYLSLKKAVATQAYQTQVIDYQKAQIICNLLTDIILPTLFLLAFVFMPLGVGMPIFAIGLVTLFYAHWQVAEMAPEDKKPELFKALDSFGDWIFSKTEPEDEAFEPFDEKAYQHFNTMAVEYKADPVLVLERQLTSKPPPKLPDGNICPE